MSNEKKDDGRVRYGKTQRDRANGYFSRKMANRDARNAYCNDQKAVNTTFPYHACNGQRNRFRITDPGKKTIFLRRLGK